MKIFLIALVFTLATTQDESEETQRSEPIYTADSVWVKVEPENIGAVFEMPREPEYASYTFENVVKTPYVVHRYKVTVNKGTANFVFVYNDLDPEMKDGRTINKTLDSAVQGAIARVLGSLKSVKSIRHGRYPGREFVYVANLNGTVLKFSTRLVLVGQRLYQQNLVMLDEAYDERLVRKFFDSFKLVKRETDLPPKPKRIKK